MLNFLKRALTPASSSPAVAELSSTQGGFLSPTSYREAEASIPSVIACADLIVNSITNMPVRLVRYEGTRAENVDDHPILKMLREPAPHLNGFADLLAVCYRSLIAYGNAAIVIDDATQRLVPIPWTHCSISSIGSDKMRYSISMPYTGKTRLYTAGQVIHLRTNATDDGGYYGKAPMQRAFRAVGLSRTIEESTTCLLYTSPSPRD